MRQWPRQVAVVLTILLAPCFTRPAESQAPIIDLATIRTSFENYFEARRLTDRPYGQYKMVLGDSDASYYASLDVALSRAIMGEDFSASLSEQQRGEWIKHLQSYALPDGTYGSTFGHSQLHANGMTIGALGALGGKQLYPATPHYESFNTPGKATHYLENSIDWQWQWGESHKFWGGLHMYGESSVATNKWKEIVFKWLDSNIDPNTGWFRNPANHVEGLGGGAHIWPAYEHMGHDFPEPEKVIDTILEMQRESGQFHSSATYQDLDALYGLRYMRDLAPDYRSADIDEAAHRFGVWLNGSINGFLTSRSSQMHIALGKVGAFGLLNQLRPDLFPDSTGAEWTGIFTEPRFYLTDQVETFDSPENSQAEED